MKDNMDLYTMSVGLISAILKGVKKHFSLKTIIISAISASFLALGTLGVVMYFMDELDMRMAIFVAFVVGWISSDITDALELIVKDSYEIFQAWMKSRVNKK
jgi:hypothetical protein